MADADTSIPPTSARQPELPAAWLTPLRIYILLVSIATGVCFWVLPSVPHADDHFRLQALLPALLIILTTTGAAYLARRAISLRVHMLHLALNNERINSLRQSGWREFDALTTQILQQKQALQRSRKESEYYRQLAESTTGLEAMLDKNLRLLWINPGSSALTGYSAEECSSADDLISLLVYSKDQKALREYLCNTPSTTEETKLEIRLAHKNGHLVWAACRWHAVEDDQGAFVGLRLSAQDIQSRKDAEMQLLETVAALRRTQALKEHYLARSNDERMRLSSVLDTVRLGIVFVDRDRRVVYVNQPAIDIWRLGHRDKIVGSRDTALIALSLPQLLNPAAFTQHIQAAVSARDHSPPFDIPFKDGRIIRQLSSIVPSSEGNRPIGRVWVYEDVTEAQHTAQHLTDLAERDPLTSLYNRRRFREEIELHLIEGARRDEPIGLLVFDLDGFKQINDSFGHQAGDEVLITLAREVSQVVRRNELFFRLGGDEFAVLVGNTNEERMQQLARRVLETVAEHRFKFDGVETRITVSIGIAIVPPHAHDSATMLTAADRAMYAAKSAGKNRIHIAEPT